MKRIVFVTNSIGFGGAEKVLTFVSNQLQQRGHACTIINLNTIGDYINSHQQDICEGVKLFTVEQPPRKANKNLFRIKAIKKIAKDIKADVIIGFTGFPNMYAKIVGTMLHIPSIMSERGDPNYTKGGSVLKEMILTFIINFSNGGVFQTEGAMEYYGKRLQKRGIVIPNPIFIKSGIPQVTQFDREKSIVSVGRLDNNQKRYDIMLQAFKMFNNKHPEYVLKIYGKGSDEEKICKWIIELGISNKVQYMGLTTQPMQDIAKAGIFFITSDFEGISNSLLEAMAVGIPCVSTDHPTGGARMLIQDHENGLLAPVGDVEKLAKALSEFAEDPELSTKCGNNAKDVANRFEPSRIINIWETYIVTICK